MSVKVPCLNCLDRTPECHSNCKRYDCFKKEHDKIKNERNKQKQFERDWYGFKFSKFKNN